jgi:hypothetical protein
VRTQWVRQSHCQAKEPTTLADAQCLLAAAEGRRRLGAVYGCRLCMYFGALFLWAMPADGAGFRVLVRSENSDGLKLAERILGQASDLDVEITVVATREFEPTTIAQLQAADRLAAEHVGQAVVWWYRTKFEEPPGGAGWWLYIAHPGRGRVVVRSLGKGTDRNHADSAVLEEAALIVRSTLEALAVGAEVGVERSFVEGSATRPPPPPSQTERKPSRSESEAAWLRPAQDRADKVFTLNAGWQIALDGRSAVGQQGPVLRAGYLGGAWQVGWTLAASVGAQAVTTPAEVHVARHSATGWLGLRTSSSRWELAGGARFGFALFTRSTSGTASGLTPGAPRRYWSPLVGPELSLSYRPSWPRRAWRIGIIAGADYVPRAPELGIGTSGAFQHVSSLWLVQPWSSLCVGREF